MDSEKGEDVRMAVRFYMRWEFRGLGPKEEVGFKGP